MKKDKIFWIISTLVINGLLLIQCEKQPAKPEHNNPLDPQNPGTGGDPFNLQAQIAGGGILLTWEILPLEAISSYTLNRQVDSSDFSIIYTSEDPTDSFYVDTSIQNGHRYTYYLLALDSAGTQLNSQYTEIEVNSSPIVSIDDENGFTALRMVNVTLLAFGANSMQVGSPDLTTVQWEDYSTQVSVELPIGGGVKIVQARFAYEGGDTSTVVSDSTNPLPMNSGVLINADSFYTATRNVTLSLTAQGALWMRVFNDSLSGGFEVYDEMVIGKKKNKNINVNNSIADTNWLPYSESLSWELSTGGGVKLVFVEFKNDFEIVESADDAINPLPMSPTFNINHNAVYTAQREVWLYPDAQGVNIECMFSENSGFVGANWSGLADSLQFTLPTGAGGKIVYSRFKNDFDIVETLSDSILPLPINPSITINHNELYTAQRLVWLYPSAQGENLSWQYSEDSTFTGVNWNSIPDSISFTLSSGGEVKTVFARYKNDFEIEEMANASISPLPINPDLEINHGDIYTAQREVWLFLSAQGENLLVQCSEDSLFNGVGWIEFGDSLTFLLSTGEGVKTVYARYQNDFEMMATANASISPLPINPSLTINHGDTYTAYREVWLFPSAQGTSLECKFSEDNTFSGVNWQVMLDSMQFMLSEGNTLKTVYGKYKNDFEIESEVVADDIIPQAISNLVQIASDSQFINHSQVNLSFPGSGALEMKVNSAPDSSAVPWQAFQIQLQGFNLSTGDGLKYVYAWFRNDFITTEVLFDSVWLDTYCAIDTFYWISNGGDTLTAGDSLYLYLTAENDNIGQDWGGLATINLNNSFQNLPLNDLWNGNYSLEYRIQAGDYALADSIMANFTDRAGNIANPFTAVEPITIMTYWENTYGGTGDEYGYSVTQTMAGGYIVAGKIGSGGSEDVLLLKVAPEGEEQWTQTFDNGGSEGAYCVKQTSDLGLIVVGYSGGDVWLIKTDAGGNMEWDRTFGGSGVDVGYSVEQTVDGGFIIAGSTLSYGSGNSDIWLIKTDEYGYQQWTKTIGSPNYEIGYEIHQTSDGGYIIVGKTGSGGFGYVRLVKTDVNGNEQWGKSYLGSMMSEGFSVDETADGGYILTGYTYSSGSVNICLIKTDSQGNSQWSQIYGGSGEDKGYGVRQTEDGGYILTGNMNDDFYVLKTNSAGVEQWSELYGGAGEDEGRCVQIAQDGGYIFTGFTNSLGAGGFDVYLIKKLPE